MNMLKKIDQAEAMDSAINGLLQSLDPYSAYMNQKIFEECKLKQVVNLEV